MTSDLIDKITDYVDELLDALALLIPIFLFIISVLGLLRLVDIYKQDHSFLPNFRQSSNSFAF